MVLVTYDGNNNGIADTKSNRFRQIFMVSFALYLLSTIMAQYIIIFIVLKKKGV